MRQHLRNEQGFTLVEVIASLVILSVILLGVLNLFVFTNKTAVTNSDRLVAINLGRTILERVKINSEEYFDLTELSEDELRDEFEYNADKCEPENCSDLYTIHINDKDYVLKLTVSQNEEEKNLSLVNVIVNIELPENDITHQVEGYVTYGTTEDVE